MKTLTTLALASMIAACGEEPDQIHHHLTETKQYETYETYETTNQYDVIVKTGLALIVADGNGVVAGFGAKFSYTDLLKKDGWSIENKGSKDKNAVTMLDTAADIDALMPEPVVEETAETVDEESEDKKPIAEPEKSLVIYQEGLNSYLAGHTPAQAYEALTTYIKARKEKGWLTMAVTMLPALQLTLGANAWRQQYNALLLENAAEADFLVDLNIDYRLADSSDVTYFQADRMHPSSAGVRALHENITGALLRARYEPKAETKNP